MQRSAPKQLTFRLTGVRGLHQGKDFKTGLLSLDARVLGKILKKEDGEKTSGAQPPTAP